MLTLKIIPVVHVELSGRTMPLTGFTHVIDLLHGGFSVEITAHNRGAAEFLQERGLIEVTRPPGHARFMSCVSQEAHKALGELLGDLAQIAAQPFNTAFETRMFEFPESSERKDQL